MADDLTQLIVWTKKKILFLLTLLEKITLHGYC